ncbi:two-component sensor histidine kinase [Methylobacterium radiotolerans]|uniref:histidine kinase n=1 Tax=Methylobacterium oryzae TaxID=334852 RepID=A0ABU7THN0_9HYPH
MSALRTRLFVVLLVATGLIWLSAVLWIYVSSKREVEHFVDTQLQEAARMVISVADRVGASPVPGGQETPIPALDYAHQLTCQIWSLSGSMLARSSGAPEHRMTDASSGFSERAINGDTWRVFTLEDPRKGIRVMVGDRLGMRERLANDLVRSFVMPVLLVVPLLALLIWVSLGRGLRPLRRMARDIAARDADDMRAIDAGRAPDEVRPLADALNALFLKVETARRHERTVTAFAAHELRTPLAGLKTQAQVAMASTDPSVVKAALRQILTAVDQTTRLVRQLLDAARLDAETDERPLIDVEVGALIAETIDGMRVDERIRTLVDPRLRDLKMRGDPESLRLAIRNLHENAVQHMGAGTIEWGLNATGTGFFVRDQGPGIPEEELPHVTTRFFRGRHKSASGSGLGLAITEMAARRSRLALLLRNRQDGSGLQVDLEAA